MIASLKRQGLYEVSMGLSKESYEYEKDWLNYGDRAYGSICGTFSRSFLIDLIEFAEYPKDLWIEYLGSTMWIVIAIWGAHSEPQEFFTQNSQPRLSLMKLFKMKKTQNLPHSQFKLKKVSLE